MKRSLFSKLIILSALAVFTACGPGNKVNSAGTAGADASASGTVYHDTTNKKVEIRHQGPNQKQTDSIKEEKTRKKK